MAGVGEALKKYIWLNDWTGLVLGARKRDWQYVSNRIRSYGQVYGVTTALDLHRVPNTRLMRKIITAGYAGDAESPVVPAPPVPKRLNA